MTPARRYAVGLAVLCIVAAPITFAMAACGVPSAVVMVWGFCIGASSARPLVRFALRDNGTR